MIYLRARYYNPQIGRFTSLDIEEGEISSPLDMNRYAYCRNNPIKYIDPSGRSVLAGSLGAALLAEAAPYIAADAAILGGAIIYFKEHSKGARPSTKGKHQEGQARRQRDAGGEKGDARRTQRKDKKK